MKKHKRNKKQGACDSLQSVSFLARPYGMWKIYLYSQWAIY